MYYFYPTLKKETKYRDLQMFYPFPQHFATETPKNHFTLAFFLKKIVKLLLVEIFNVRGGRIHSQNKGPPRDEAEAAPNFENARP